jgi:hypothetical protein
VFFKSIHAITCTAQQGAPSGDENSCGGGGTLRTDGDNSFPCQLRAAVARRTYVCHLDLPSGALIEEILAYGNDFDAPGYIEAAVWRTLNTTFGPQYISPTFLGTWQHSSLVNPGFTQPVVTVYLDTDPAHVVDGNYRYDIGIALKGAATFDGLRVKYTIP